MGKVVVFRTEGLEKVREISASSSSYSSLARRAGGGVTSASSPSFLLGGAADPAALPRTRRHLALLGRARLVASQDQPGATLLPLLSSLRRCVAPAQQLTPASSLLLLLPPLSPSSLLPFPLLPPSPLVPRPPHLSLPPLAPTSRSISPSPRSPCHRPLTDPHRLGRRLDPRPLLALDRDQGHHARRRARAESAPARGLVWRGPGGRRGRAHHRAALAADVQGRRAGERGWEGREEEEGEGEARSAEDDEAE